MNQRLDKINKLHNKIGSRPKLEPRHKRAQGPTNIKIKINRTKWGVYKYKMTQRLDKINKQHNRIDARHKLEP